MLIEKLEWVRHVTLRDERAPIYSIDLHPDGRRFATGAGDSKIKIWSTKSLLEDGSGSEASGDEAEAPSPAGNGTNGEAASAAKDLMASRMAGPKSTAKTQDSPELLAVLASHTDPVNCVRWSSKGRFLASASDDRFIIIWEQRAAGMPSSAPFGSEAVKNVENWGQAYTLQGHSLNIMDINWSPDDTMLASASLDNRVLIWPMRAALNGERGVAIQPLLALDGHGNQVKGVAWDPVGKYLATSAQDNTLMVWRTSDWEVQARVAKPFQETAKQESLFRRISWSPDGGSICATNASKKSRHVAALLSRGNDWASDTDLVGHERPVVATRFCPTIFRKKDAASGVQKHSTLVALGDDNSGLLTIWSSVRSRPLLVVKDVFAGGTTDLTWARDGRLLLASSLDGTVCMLSFDQGELGAGKPLAPAEMAALFMRTYGSGASEGTVLREHALMAKATGSKSSTAPSMEPSSPSTAFAGSSSMGSPAPPAAPSASSSSGMTTNWLQPRPKDGKKRIRPQLLGSHSGSLSGGPDSQAGLASPSTTKRLRPLGAPVSLAQVTRGPVVSVVVEKESVSFTVDCPYDKAGVLTRILNDFDGLGGHVDEMAMDDDSGFGGPSRRLPVTVDVSITERPGVGQGPSLGPISHVKVSTNGEVVWKEALPGRAKCVCGNGALVGVGCSDGSVHLLQGNSGLRLCPPLMMGGPVALLECTPLPTATPSDGPKPRLAMHVMGVDQLGGLRVWDTYAMRSVVHTSVKPLFTSLAADAPTPKPPSASVTSAPRPAAPTAAPVAKIVRAEVGKNGRPRLEVASGGKGGAVQAFVFDGALDSWMRVHDSRYVVSDFASSSSGYGGGAGVLAVSTLLREEEDKAVQREVTRGHLEERLASAVAAGGKADVTYYLRLLVTRLSKAGQVGRLRALCDRLMGRLGTSEEEDEEEPEAAPSNLAYWRPDQKWLVPGELSKREALTSLVLPIMSEAMDSAAIQRLVKHCHEALKDTTSS